jgi:CrcB protein
LIQKLLLLMFGGATGTLARYGLVMWVGQGQATPSGTVLVNALGCLGFGLIWGIADARGTVGTAGTVAVLAGFMGAFTTFSAYAFETHQIARDTNLFWTGGYLIIHNVVGISLLFVGLWLSRIGFASA